MIVPSLTLIEAPSILASRYNEQQFLHIPHFLSTESVQKLLSATETVPIDMVICGEKTISFGQQKFTNDHLLHQFLAQKEIVRLMFQLTQTDRLHHFMCWTSVYQTGQYINSHRDKSGSIQLIVCLQMPTNCGGHLHLYGAQGEQIEESATS